MSSRSDKPMTAADLMRELQADPEHAAKVEAQEAKRGAATAAAREAAVPIVAELRAAGFEVDAIADLHNRALDYEAAVPVLLRWLPQVENAAVEQDVVRALSVEWARPDAAAPLVAAFRAADDDGVRWAIGNALAVVADDSVFDDVAALATDRSGGRAREMIAVALGNMTDPRAVDVLRELLADDEVAGHALIGLGRLGAAEAARDDVEPFLEHPVEWVREEARRLLAR